MTSTPAGILPVPRTRWPWYAGGFAFILSIASSLYMAWAVGRNLGLMLGGLALVAILAPTIVLTQILWRARVLIVTGIGCGIAAIWLGCIFNDSITFWEWGQCVVVLIVFGFAVAGLAALLVRIRISPPAAAA